MIFSWSHFRNSPLFANEAFYVNMLFFKGHSFWRKNKFNFCNFAIF